MLPSSLLEKIASIKEGSSCGANACLITRLQTGVLRSKRMKNRGAISFRCKIGEHGDKDVPLSNAGVVAATCSIGNRRVTHSSSTGTVVIAGSV